jgi:flagellar assembly protein FliH
MKSMQGRVIKSEDVKLVNKGGKAISRPGRHGIGKTPGITDEMGMYDDLNAIKDIYAKKIQIAEREALEKGLAQGIMEGRELQKQETLQSTQALGALIHDLSELKKKILETAEEQILQLALAVSEKVIHMETQTNREVVQHVLRAAMKNIVDRENMKIRLHPHDFQYMMEIKPDFLRNLDGVKNIVFEEDASIVRGGAIIETMFGEVDARLDHQYNQIKSSLTTPPRSG